MNRPNSSQIRFELLKILKNSPTHGYNLYLLLSQKMLVKNPSELYKILRTLKEKGLLREESKDSEVGPQRKILSLTPAGLEEYYAQVSESIQIFTDLMTEAIITIFGNLLTDFLRKSDIEFSKLENRSLFFDFVQFPVQFQREFLLRLVVPLQAKNNVYIRLVNATRDDIIPLLDKIASNLKMLDENLNIKAQSMDLIFLMGIEHGLIFKDRVRNYAAALKPNGGIVLIRPRMPGPTESWGSGRKIPPPLFDTVFRDFIRTFPPKFRQQFFLQRPPSEKEFERPTQRLSNLEIRKFLEENFTQVQAHEQISFFNIFFARNPKTA